MNTHTEIVTGAARIQVRWLDFIKRVGTMLSNTRNILKRSRQRRLAIRELNSLSDKILCDIGIPRSNIREIVDDMLAKQARSASSVTKWTEISHTVPHDSDVCETCV